MRISTAQFYNQSVQALGDHQSQLNQLYQQLSSGQALSTPADDPLHAAQAVTLTMNAATLTQYKSNQNVALGGLQLQDQTLASVAGVMQSISSLIVRAGDGSLQDADRASIAKTMQGYRDQLFTLANTSDSTGAYLFSGFQSTTQPFANNPSGGVTYLGDNGIRQIQVHQARQIPVSNSGAALFMSVPSVGTSTVVAGASSNTGTGTINRATVNDPTVGTNSDRFTITFAGTAAAPTYTVTDNTAGSTSAATAFTADSPIALGSGMAVTISGVPNAGDTFTVTPATDTSNSSLFSSVDALIGTLMSPAEGNTAAKATLTNALATGLTRFQNSLASVTVAQASVGGREQELQALQTTTQNNALATANALSDVTSVDLVATISQYQLTQTTLQAAQQAFVKMQGMSLFNFMN